MRKEKKRERNKEKEKMKCDRGVVCEWNAAVMNILTLPLLVLHFFHFLFILTDPIPFESTIIMRSISKPSLGSLLSCFISLYISYYFYFLSSFPFLPTPITNSYLYFYSFFPILSYSFLLFSILFFSRLLLLFLSFYQDRQVGWEEEDLQTHKDI